MKANFFQPIIYGVIMDSQDTNLEPQKIEQTFSKVLFPTEIRCFTYPFSDDLIKETLDLANKQQFNDEIKDLIHMDAPCMEQWRNFIYDICSK